MSFIYLCLRGKKSHFGRVDKILGENAIRSANMDLYTNKNTLNSQLAVYAPYRPPWRPTTLTTAATASCPRQCVEEERICLKKRK